MKIIGIVILILGEGLSLLTLWTAWYGSGMKDPIASILLFIPCVVLVIPGWLLLNYRYWWFLIPPALVVMDVIMKVRS